MDWKTLSALAHADHPIAAPLSDSSVSHLLDRAVRTPNARLLDLGCGEGAWLLRALQAHDGTTAVGVDHSDERFADTREQATALGVAARLELHHQDLREYRSARKADVVLCVGATHAFGGLMPTLDAVRRHLAESGVALVGTGFWEREPDATTLAELGAGPQDYADLATTVAEVVADGWTPVYAHTSTLAEWDEYEWCWTGTLAQWALDHPGHPDRDHVFATATSHRNGWLNGYRGTLGFVTLMLRQTGLSNGASAR
jgi:SAM-dependent methyltransferase